MKTEIHIWDLPSKRAYIKLKDGFREKFFDNLRNEFDSWKNAGKFFKIKRGDTLLARNWRDGMCCCPLETVFRFCTKLEIPKELIETNIQEIRFKTKIKSKGGNSGKSLVNPKLPIQINEDFAEILGHICGDGCIVITSKKGISLKYTNSERTLIKSFQEKIRNVFGDIKPNIQIRKGKNYRVPNYQSWYPSIISLFILSVFDCKTDDKKNVPEFILNSPNRLKCRFLRALFDDEGTVNVNSKKVVLDLKPLEQLTNIRKLLVDIGISPSKVYAIGKISKMNRLEILGKNNFKLFKKNIGFKHPLKIKKLNLILERGWKFERFENFGAKQRIISFLKKKDYSTEEISNYLKRSAGTIRGHLLNLQKEGLIQKKKIIKRIGKGNIGYNKWRIKYE